mgnify:CR=1 FL=1
MLQGAYFLQIWLYVTIYGHIWTYLWPYMAIYGTYGHICALWSDMAIHIWPYIASALVDMLSVDALSVDTYMAIYGHMATYMAIHIRPNAPS